MDMSGSPSTYPKPFSATQGSRNADTQDHTVMDSVTVIAGTCFLLDLSLCHIQAEEQ